ncbi:NUDIX domain-containing protein [Nocardioides rubriscoriae]|uniref:NUDIX domain-containing protein n=1 Tax=Nocardioides rubriscoriae TaxID=642762 RepID=UPI001FEA62AE|nr:NUDIX domain-containing protein [Nocardioides rubriscoriae]
MPSFACVVLVDRRGWVLLQERDEHAPIDPECWGMSGGHVEDGESPEAAAYRELREETGLDLPPGTLRHHTTLHVFHEHHGTTDPVDVYVAGVDLTDADVVCHEGRRIVFVDPATIGDLPLTHSAAQALPGLLDTDAHRELRWAAHGRTRYSCVALVDRRGWILLQERDEHAPVAPEAWSLPGGGLEPGESYADAARRELAEETGVAVDADDLHLVGAFAIDRSAQGPAADFEVWAAATHLVDAQVECHEGRQMVFVDPVTAASLPMARATALVLPALLESDLYQELIR